MFDYGPLLLQHRNLGPDQRLKIGVMIGGRKAPRWIRDVVEYLEGVPQFEVSVLLAPDSPAAPAAPSWLAERLHAASRRKFDPFADAEIGLEKSEALGGIDACQLDMLIWLAGKLPEGSCAGLARSGVFTLELSDGKTAPPYWREVIDGDPVSPLVVYWHEQSFARARPVYRAEFSTQRDWTFTRNAEAPLASVPRIFATIALELLTDGRGWLDRARAVPEVERPLAVKQTLPSTSDVLRFMSRQALRSAEIRISGRGRMRRWFIALRRKPSLFYANLGRFSAAAFEEIPLHGTHMADPFVVTDNDKSWLFFEYVPPGSRNGKLSCMELSGDMQTAKPQVILEKDYHLSYPCVFAHAGEYFMIPESSADRTVRLYRASRFPFEFRHETNLIEDFPAVDTTPFFHDGRWYFFTTTIEPLLETFLFRSDKLGGGWQLHPMSPISSSVRNTRGAGHLFYQNGRLLRPTQDCSVRYGYGITMNEIKRLSPTEFEEERVDFIGPRWRRGLLGTHTLNSSAEFEVIDGIRYQK